MTLRLEHDLTRHEADHATRALRAAVGQGSGTLSVDLSAVRAIDSAGAAVLADFAQRARAAGRPVEMVGTHPAVARTLKLFPALDKARVVVPERPPWRERLGGGSHGAWTVFVDYVLLCADVLWFLVGGLFVKKGIRWTAVVMEMYAMGSSALGVAGLIAFLVGGTVALQAAAQLRQFGANLFVADLIGVSITRELGPLITAIVVAGRSGSAVAAEIGTMMITEEIDALRTMGIHPTRFLIVPKVLAICITQPLLSMLASALAIFGGFLVAILYLDVSAAAFVGRLQVALFVKDVLTGLFKSVMFAALIVTIGSLCGLRTAGGADAVGRSTTTSVVAAIFAIIVTDAAASLLFYFGA